MSDQEASTISRYLLGELPPEEMDALEARLLTESGLFDLAESVEDEVIDRYVRGELSAAEAKRFERRLLPAERIRERVAFARALAKRRAERTIHRRQGHRPLAPVIPLFRSPARLAWAATLVACLAAGTLGFEVFQLRDRAAGLEQARAVAVEQLEHLAEARRAESTPPAPAAVAVETDEEADQLADQLTAARERIEKLEADAAARTERRIRQPGKVESEVSTASVFVPLVTRGPVEPTIVEPAESESIELQLELGPRRPKGPVVGTVLRADQPVWRETRVAVTTLDGESIASLELPSNSLLDGRYTIELVDGDAGSPFASYPIIVSR